MQRNSEHSVHIVGRGIVGLAIGYELIRRGFRVTIVGPKDVRGSASRAAVGVSSLKGHIQPSQQLFSAKMKGHHGLSNWLGLIESDSGRRIPQIRAGVCEPFFDVHSFKYLSERIFHGKFRGCFRAQMIEGPEIVQRYGDIFDEKVPRGGFLYPGDLWFDPECTLDALEIAIERLGGSFLSKRVRCVRPGDGSNLILDLFDEGGISQGFEGTSIKSQNTVLAAGPFTSEILNQSQLPDLKILYCPGETLFAPTDFEKDVNLRIGKVNYVAYQKRLRFGSTSRNAENLDREIAFGPSREDAHRLWRGMKEHGLRLSHSLELGEIKWGVRTRVRDRAPVVGPLMWPGIFSHKVWVATGFYKNGLQLSGLFAQYLADSLMGAPSIMKDQQVIQSLVSPQRLR